MISARISDEICIRILGVFSTHACGLVYRSMMKWLIRRRRETVVIFSSWNVWFVHVIRVGHPKPSQVLKTVNFGLFSRNIEIPSNFTVEFGVASSVKWKKLGGVRNLRWSWLESKLNVFVEELELTWLYRLSLILDRRRARPTLSPTFSHFATISSAQFLSFLSKEESNIRSSF